MKRLRTLLMVAALLCAGRLCAQDDPAAADATDMVTPASDKEETGALTDILPDRVELLLLPGQEEPGTTMPAMPHGGLFPDEFPPETFLEMPGDPADTPAATPSAGTSSVEPLPPQVAASCFGPSPPPPLHDPQHLLTPSQAAPLLALLRDSLNARGTFQTSVVVLKPSQQIPLNLNPGGLLQNWYGSGKGLLVLYFLGQPDRTQAFFSPETRLHHRTEDLRQVIEFGVREAARMNAPVAQLQRFCYKTGVRLDRLHRHGIVTPSDEPAGPAAATVAATSLWWAFAVGVQAAALGCGAVWWWRRRRAAAEGRDGDTIRLPEQDLICRLGAPHSGGSGAVIQFGIAGQRL